MSDGKFIGLVNGVGTQFANGSLAVHTLPSGRVMVTAYSGFDRGGHMDAADVVLDRDGVLRLLGVIGEADAEIWE